MKVNFLSVPLNPETTPPDGQAIAIPLGDNGTDPRNILHYVDFATLLKPGAVLMAGDFYGNGRVPGVDGLLGIKIIHSSPNDFDVVQYDASNEELDRGILGNFKLSSIFGGVLAHTGTTETIDRTWFGKLNLFTNVAAKTINLDSTLSSRVACLLRNDGAGLATLVPSTGAIDNNTLANGETGWLFFDGTNWKFSKWGSSSVLTDGGFQFIIDAGSSVPTTGYKRRIIAPFSGTITGWTITANASGSATFTIKKSDYATFPTTASIVASAKPTLTSAQKAISTTLTGWTTTVTKGDILECYLDTVATVHELNLHLQVTKTS
jgi:hypothetical protein